MPWTLLSVLCWPDLFRKREERSMSLDIRFTAQEGVVCPKCGEVVAARNIMCEESGGRGWYDILEKIGYYVPYDQRTEENDWYGKDMTLTEEQADMVYMYVVRHKDLYNVNGVLGLIASALHDGNSVVVNADW